MGTTLTIAKREFRAYFDSPVAYVVICLSLLGLGVVFFFGTLVSPGFFQANRASLQQMFTLLPWLLSGVVIPVITMRALAEEKRSGTLEMLITLPVKDHEVILGKFLGAWGLVLMLVIATAAYPVLMFGQPWDMGALDTGPIVTGYIGMVLYSAAAVSIGLFISSMTDSQIIAFFITFVLLMMLHAAGLFSTVAGPVGYISSFVSLDSHLLGFQRGMVNTRDIIYFLTIVVGSLMGAFWALERRKWA